MLMSQIGKDELEVFIIEAEKKQRRNFLKLRVLQGMTLILVVSVILFLRTVVGQAQLQEGIANQIIRFHVLANSDSQNDQELKLDVKDKITSYLQGKLRETSTKEEARTIIQQEMGQLKTIAESEITRQGYDYPVTIRLEHCYFPVKQYGDLTFPAGQYEALRVLIGEAEGKNWWCVMFPSLCFVNETYSVVPDESKDKLKHVLDEEEYEAIDGKSEKSDETKESEETKENKEVEPEISIRFRVVDFFQGFLN